MFSQLFLNSKRLLQRKKKRHRILAPLFFQDFVIEKQGIKIIIINPTR